MKRTTRLTARHRLVAVAALSATLGGAAVSVTAAAQPAPDEPATTVEASPPPESEPTPAPAPDAEPESDDTVMSCDFGELSAEEIAEINSQTDALVEFLAEKGVTVEVETDEDGVRVPAFDEDTPDSTWELVDEFYGEMMDELGLPVEELTPELIAEINADTDDLVKFLAEKGVTVEVETDEDGIRVPAFDENTPDSTWELVEEFYGDQDGDLGYPMGELTPEVIAQVNDNTDALVEFLAENGVTVEVTTDEDGLRYPDFPEDTPDSTWDLIDEFYETVDVPDPAVQEASSVETEEATVGS